MSSDIIFLFANISISTNIKLENMNNNNSHITKIITTCASKKISDCDKYTVKIEHVEVDKNIIDFNSISHTIIESIKNNESIVLYDDDMHLMLVVIASFLSKNTSCSFYTCLAILLMKTNVKISDVNKSYLIQLFNSSMNK
jgi:hypothetical protein